MLNAIFFLIVLWFVKYDRSNEIASRIFNSGLYWTHQQTHYLLYLYSIRSNNVTKGRVQVEFSSFNKTHPISNSNFMLHASTRENGKHICVDAYKWGWLMVYVYNYKRINKYDVYCFSVVILYYAKTYYFIFCYQYQFINQSNLYHMTFIQLFAQKTFSIYC